MRLPRLAHLVLVLDDVLVGAVHGELERTAGAAHRALEARIARDRVVGQDAAVAPAADAEPRGIGDAFLDRPVHARQQVHHFLVAPVAEDGRLEVLAAAMAAAIVDLQHRVAVGGDPFAVEHEAVRVLPVGAAVDVKDERQLRRRRDAGRQRQQGTDAHAVLVGELDRLHGPERQLLRHPVVVAGQLAQARRCRAHRSPRAVSACSP